MKTIVAIATALSPAGIAVVRMSGPDSVKIADKLFRSVGGRPVSEFEPRKLTLGTFLYDDVGERCLAVRFAAPYSYTGEDVTEFQIHGGVRLAELVVEAAIHGGARLAEPGEFTRRAFLNGKLTLAEAEGAIDTIEAKETAELRASYSLVGGELGRRVGAIRAGLVDLCSSIEVAIDYPEEDLELDTLDVTRQKLSDALGAVDALLATRRTGMIVKDGLSVALVGKPNVGKSSLLNRLLGVERAIVTEIAGTTRDHISESVRYRGIRFRFIDTAGLRDTSDRIEAAGVEQSRRIAAEADAIVMLVDPTFDAQDRSILDALPAGRIVVCNKSDLGAADVPCDLTISCKTGEGIETLKEKLYAAFVDGSVVAGGVMLTNARHFSALTAAREALVRALAAPALDLVPVDARDAIAELGKIDGATVSSDVTDAIFAKFCLGK